MYVTIYDAYQHPSPAENIRRRDWCVTRADAGEIGRSDGGLLIPLKPADPSRLAAVLARAGALAKVRDAAADEAALAEMGIDPTDWSVAFVSCILNEARCFDRVTYEITSATLETIA